MNESPVSESPVSEARALLTSLTFWTLMSALCVGLCGGLVGCERAQERLQGSWRVDLEALSREPIARLATPPAGPLAHTLREGAYHDWRFTFHTNQALEATLRGRHYEGRYVISKIVSGTLYLRLEARAALLSPLDERLGLSPLELPPLSERVTLKVKGERATLRFDDDQTLPLKRLTTGI